MTEYKNILFDVKNQIGTLTINRPKALNALNSETLNEIYDLVKAIEGGQFEIHFLIITGAGDKAFVAGADIKEMANLNPLEARDFSRLGSQVFKAIQNLSLPTLAAINGYALGGGLELSMACDLRFACENAVVGLPEVGLGVIPGFGGTQRLPRIIGLAKANEFLFTGGNLKADVALEAGLFNRLYPVEQLLPEAYAYAEKVIKKAPIAVRYAKLAASKGIDMSLDKGLDYESELFGLLFATEDQSEGMGAFVEKREAEFKNQ
ncbi:enoyl-CoA hydratase-related protein [Eremococcus coleocola]|uniref:Enoyl-CoA hydratase/isomerase family protein n=1 Tax=Eremococcus coleocola ACS-139-V-Col8 TaxID=908337 RepID=E4KQP5_9LACT|nr:enoyl-CoA hydratase-related protein [Eremococcus coleocola]EFR30644.1 enoyl-CoA hydratase/isomerase family protein [Eremococcus coleocola ACS-139-V-Col8]